MKIFSRHISKPTGSGADLVGVPPKESKRFLSASLTAPEDQAFLDLSKKTPAEGGIQLVRTQVEGGGGFEISY